MHGRVQAIQSFDTSSWAQYIVESNIPKRLTQDRNLIDRNGTLHPGDRIVNTLNCVVGTYATGSCLDCGFKAPGFDFLMAVHVKTGDPKPETLQQTQNPKCDPEGPSTQ